MSPESPSFHEDFSVETPSSGKESERSLREIRNDATEALQDYNDIITESEYKPGLRYDTMSNDELNEINALPVNDRLLELSSEAGKPANALEHWNNLRGIFAPGTGRSVDAIKTDPENVDHFRINLSGAKVLEAVTTNIDCNGDEKNLKKTEAEECFQTLFDRDGVYGNLLASAVQNIESGNLPPDILGDEAPRTVNEVLKEITDVETQLATTKDKKQIDGLTSRKGQLNVELLQSLSNGENKTLRDLTTSSLSAFQEKRLEKRNEDVKQYQKEIEEMQNKLKNTYPGSTTWKQIYPRKKELEDYVSKIQAQIEALQSFGGDIDKRSGTRLYGRETLPKTF